MSACFYDSLCKSSITDAKDEHYAEVAFKFYCYSFCNKNQLKPLLIHDMALWSKYGKLFSELYIILKVAQIIVNSS